MFKERIRNTPQLLQKIRSGDEHLLKELYEQYREGFIHWAARQYQADEDQAAEIYQKAFISLYYNIKDGKLTQLNSSLKTYLFAIGKNMFRDLFKRKDSQHSSLDMSRELGELNPDILDEYQHEHQKKVVSQLLHMIGEPCKTVLKLFYFKGYSPEAISIEMNYKDERVVRKRKSVCLKQLRDLMGKEGREVWNT